MVKLIILKIKGKLQIGRRYLHFILLCSINQEEDKHSIRKMGKKKKEKWTKDINTEQMRKLKWPIKILKKCKPKRYYFTLMCEL